MGKFYEEFSKAMAGLSSDIPFHLINQMDKKELLEKKEFLERMERNISDEISHLKREVQDDHLMKKFETLKGMSFTEQEALFGIRMILTRILS